MTLGTFVPNYVGISAPIINWTRKYAPPWRLWRAWHATRTSAYRLPPSCVPSARTCRPQPA